MDSLKQFSRSTLLALAGVLLVLLALSNGLELGPLKYAANPSIVARILIAGLGLALIVAGLMFEIIFRRNAGQAATPPVAASKISIDDVFKTLDDLPGFQIEAPGARRISILGRTAVNILSSYQRVFRDVCQAGCEVRLIFVDPTSEASRYLYGSQIEVYKNNLQASVSQVSTLANAIGPRLAIRTTKDVPPFSLVHIEKEGNSYFRVQLNFMHSRIGRDRPVFMVSEHDAWYQAFVDEFEAIWHEGAGFDEQAVLRQLGGER